MTQKNFSSRLKYYLLRVKNKPSEGFSLIEIMVAMTMLSLAFAVNLQFLLLLKVQNLDQELTAGAVSITKEILEGSRARWKLGSVAETPRFRQTPTSVTPIVNQPLSNPGTTTFSLSDARKQDFGGYKYNIVVNICTNENPTITDGVVSNCQSNSSSDNRTVIVQVKHPKLLKYEYNKSTGKTKAITREDIIHSDQATFTKLQQ
jgi:prepilin-type N-terminal cleavage/methylation domain-containing protein